MRLTDLALLTYTRGIQTQWQALSFLSERGGGRKNTTGRGEGAAERRRGD